jgi:hypothetical protein
MVWYSAVTVAVPQLGDDLLKLKPAYFIDGRQADEQTNQHAGKAFVSPALYTHTYYTVNRMEQLINCQQKN